MKALIAAVVSGLFVLGAAGSASAQTVRVQSHYAPETVYYGPPDAYVAPDPDWRAGREWRRERHEDEWRRAEWQRRQEWRRAEWRRREEWRREQWRREQWRRDKWRHHRDGWDD